MQIYMLTTRARLLFNNCVALYEPTEQLKKPFVIVCRLIHAVNTFLAYNSVLGPWLLDKTTQMSEYTV